jgi:3-phenylpropionate/trans-cinnamate dioxygenase ferredoxin reductase subunit
MVAPTFVVVGASLAGARAASALRDEGFDGRVVLVGEEAALPYERPPLSKSYLRGESSLAAAEVFDEAHYASHDIELLLGVAATGLDATRREVRLADGSTIEFDRLLLATGASPRRLTVPGASLDGVHYLRSARDADVIRAAAAAGGPMVVIGAGWIGTEVAASARQLGAEVTVVDVAGVPLERVLGTEVGGVFAELHRAHGVRLRLGTGITGLRGTGHVEEVTLDDGATLPAAAVVVGVGVEPRTELAAAAGLAIDNGVVTDAQLRTTVDSVFAAGDVASAFHPRYGTHLRLEHWSAALNQGPVAARNMLGGAVEYDRTPFFYSDQYDFGMEYRGWARDFDLVVFRGDRTEGAFLAFWLWERRVVAAMNANVWDVGDQLDALVRAATPVDPARLADAQIPLEALVPA